MLALKAVGASVADTSMVGGGFPDLVCKFRGTVYLIEVKTEKGKLNQLEEEFYSEWKDAMIIAHNPEEALKGIGVAYG